MQTYSPFNWPTIRLKKNVCRNKVGHPRVKRGEKRAREKTLSALTKKPGDSLLQPHVTNLNLSPQTWEELLFLTSSRWIIELLRAASSIKTHSDFWGYGEAIFTTPKATTIILPFTVFNSCISYTQLQSIENFPIERQKNSEGINIVQHAGLLWLQFFMQF